MIVVMVQVESSASDIDGMRSMLEEMETATLKEVGCHDYCFAQEVTNPDGLRITEVWESMEALQAHFATPHMATFNAALASHPPKSMQLKVHELGAELELPS